VRDLCGDDDIHRVDPLLPLEQGYYTGVMEIATLGWGSLIWCPGSLKVKTKWRSGGPRLPIEFARISGDGRLTLVIEPGAEDQPTYWALSDFDTIEKARENLQEREGITNSSMVHHLTADRQIEGNVVRHRIQEWLGARSDVGAVVWTGLTSNWREKRGQDLTREDAVQYLKEPESARDQASATYKRAREYVTNTPAGVQTAVRRAMQNKGWRDTELSSVLFED